MICSKTCDYAIRSLRFLAVNGRPRTILEVSAEIGVPKAYLAKLFQRLARGGILSSRPGRNGGYAMKADPRKLTFFEVMDAVDRIENSVLSRCGMGRKSCNKKKPCLLHAIWAKARDQANRALKRETIL